MNVYDCLFAIVTIVFWIWGLGIAKGEHIEQMRRRKR